MELPESRVAEETLVAEETKVPDALDTPELNMAAKEFNAYMPHVAAVARNMNGKGLARVFRAVIEFPFANKEPKFVNNTERELFLMTLSVMSAKNTMIAAIAKNQEEIKQLQDQAVDAIVEATVGEKNG